MYSVPGDPVVQRIGASRPGLGRKCLAHAVVDGRDIDLVQHLVAVLEPADVEDHRGGQHDAEHHLVGAGAIAETDQAVVHHQHDDGAHQRLGDGAAPAAQRIAADDGGGDGEDLLVQARAGACTRQAAGDEEARNPAAQAGDHVGHEHRLAHPDAGVVRRAARTADGEDVPAGPRAGERDVEDDGRAPRPRRREPRCRGCRRRR